MKKLFSAILLSFCIFGAMNTGGYAAKEVNLPHGTILPPDGQKYLASEHMEMAFGLKSDREYVAILKYATTATGDPYPSEKLKSYESRLGDDYKKPVFRKSCLDGSWKHAYKIECQMQYHAVRDDGRRDLFAAQVSICRDCGGVFQTNPAYVLTYEGNNPVDIKNGTRIFWNDEDITDELVPSVDTSTAGFYLVEAMSSKGFENELIPVDGFQLAQFDVATKKLPPPTTDSKLGFFWKAGGVDYTYAVDGRAVSEVRFKGFDKRYITALTPEGVTFQLSDPGHYVLAYSVKDSAGDMRDSTTWEIDIAKPKG